MEKKQKIHLTKISIKCDVLTGHVHFHIKAFGIESTSPAYVYVYIASPQIILQFTPIV